MINKNDGTKLLSDLVIFSVLYPDIPLDFHDLT